MDSTVEDVGLIYRRLCGDDARLLLGKEALMTPHLRWMIRRDMPEVLEIERLAFPNPWSHEDFISLLRTRSVIGMTAEFDNRVAGFFIYELHRDRIELLNLAVHRDCQRRGIGTAIIEKLRSKLSPQRRQRITLNVRESNMDAQLFFRAQGFKATRVVHDLYSDSDEDAYVFEYAVTEQINVLIAG